MIVVAIYASILLVGLLFAIPRRPTLLIRGSGFFLLTVIAAGMGVALSTARLVWLPILALALVVRPGWYLLRYDPAPVATEMEDAFRMLLIPFLKTGTGYTLRLRDGEVLVHLRRGPCHTAVLNFRQARGHKKTDLLRALLRKKFAPLFPRPRIHIR